MRGRAKRDLDVRERERSDSRAAWLTKGKSAGENRIVSRARVRQMADDMGDTLEKNWRRTVCWLHKAYKHYPRTTVYWAGTARFGRVDSNF